MSLEKLDTPSHERSLNKDDDDIDEENLFSDDDAATKSPGHEKMDLDPNLSDDDETSKLLWDDSKIDDHGANDSSLSPDKPLLALQKNKSPQSTSHSTLDDTPNKPPPNEKDDDAFGSHDSDSKNRKETITQSIVKDSHVSIDEGVGIVNLDSKILKTLDRATPSNHADAQATVTSGSDVALDNAATELASDNENQDGKKDKTPSRKSAKDKSNVTGEKGNGTHDKLAVALETPRKYTLSQSVNQQFDKSNIESETDISHDALEKTDCDKTEHSNQQVNPTPVLEETKDASNEKSKKFRPSYFKSKEPLRAVEVYKEYKGIGVYNSIFGGVEAIEDKVFNKKRWCNGLSPTHKKMHILIKKIVERVDDQFDDPYTRYAKLEQLDADMDGCHSNTERLQNYFDRLTQSSDIEMSPKLKLTLSNSQDEKIEGHQAIENTVGRQNRQNGPSNVKNESNLKKNGPSYLSRPPIHVRDVYNEFTRLHHNLSLGDKADVKTATGLIKNLSAEKKFIHNLVEQMVQIVELNFSDSKSKESELNNIQMAIDELGDFWGLIETYVSIAHKTTTTTNALVHGRQDSTPLGDGSDQNNRNEDEEMSDAISFSSLEEGNESEHSHALNKKVGHHDENTRAVQVNQSSSQNHNIVKDDDSAGSLENISSTQLKNGDPAFINAFRPSYFSNENPPSVIEVYNEYLGLDKFDGVPVPGGVKAIESLPLVGKRRKWETAFKKTKKRYHGIVKALATMMEQYQPDVRVEVMRELDKVRHETGVNFWDFFESYTSGKNEPHASHVIEVEFNSASLQHSLEQTRKKLLDMVQKNKESEGPGRVQRSGRGKSSSADNNDSEIDQESRSDSDSSTVLQQPKKKIGRPRKTTPLKNDDDNDSEIDRESQGDSSAVLQKPKKKIGRPRKTAQQKNDDDFEIDNESQSDSSGVKKKTKKKMGRPLQKNVDDSEIDNESQSDSSVVKKKTKKKIGRPRKTTPQKNDDGHDSEGGSESDSSSVKNKPKKKVGRPRKTTPPKNDDGHDSEGGSESDSSAAKKKPKKKIGRPRKTAPQKNDDGHDSESGSETDSSAAKKKPKKKIGRPRKTTTQKNDDGHDSEIGSQSESSAAKKKPKKKTGRPRKTTPQKNDDEHDSESGNESDSSVVMKEPKKKSGRPRKTSQQSDDNRSSNRSARGSRKLSSKESTTAKSRRLSRNSPRSISRGVSYVEHDSDTSEFEIDALGDDENNGDTEDSQSDQETKKVRSRRRNSARKEGAVSRRRDKSHENGNRKSRGRKSMEGEKARSTSRNGKDDSTRGQESGIDSQLDVEINSESCHENKESQGRTMKKQTRKNERKSAQTKQDSGSSEEMDHSTKQQAEKIKSEDSNLQIGKGMKVKKKFLGEYFEGEVIKGPFFTKSAKSGNEVKVWTVRYSDGDKEDLELHELQPILQSQSDPMQSEREPMQNKDEPLQSNSEPLQSKDEPSAPQSKPFCLKSFKPNYFSSEPTRARDAYDEYNGFGVFKDPPGGVKAIEGKVFAHINRSWASMLSGKFYPFHRIVKAMVRLVEERHSDLESRYDELDRFDVDREEEGTGFWEFFQLLSGTKGKLPHELAGKRKSAASDVDLPTKRLRRSLDEPLLEHENLFATFLNPHKVFTEESSFLYAGFGFSKNQNLQGLPSPPPAPEIPKDLSHIWSYEEGSRVLLADFRKVQSVGLIQDEHKRFFFEMLQRDDITIVSEGLFDMGERDLEAWYLRELKEQFGNHYYCKFRRFDQKDANESLFEEVDGFVSMRVSDFLKYLSQRERVVQNDAPLVDRSFVYVDVDGVRQEISDVTKVALYMIDVEIETHLRGVDEDFLQKFRMKEVVPGGSKCMMNWIHKPSRPFMGPNLYISPGGGFTHFHQDGHGTVDSGHCVITGFNEVVMLRRMPESYKRIATDILLQNAQHGKEYDPLYSFPHGDRGEQGDRPEWPSFKTVQQWKANNFCPSVFILKPGQHVHINKGRLHCFRKATPRKLPVWDCHAKLREGLTQKLIESKNNFPALCISIAWDWMFMGWDADGTNREVASILECAALCRLNKKKSLASPEVALLNMARSLSRRLRSGDGDGKSEQEKRMKEICRGILPSYEFLVDRQCRASKNALIHADSGGGRKQDHISVDRLVDINKNPELCSVNPRGNDYFCKICSAELSNVYFHCDGCESLLNRDFDICIECFNRKEYKNFHSQHPRKRGTRDCQINHITFQDGASCSCEKEKITKCFECGKCSKCNCHCHTCFTLHWRYDTDDDVRNVLSDLKYIVADEDIEFAEETKTRLEIASGHVSDNWKIKLERLMKADKERASFIADMMETKKGRDSPLRIADI